ncbi:MAG: 4-(cytidine 5'-diphospho)-2-C-methyl-D-erythritol kinase [Pseudomonadota bacterium]
MTTVEVFAPAKLNLTLHVTGQRDDGYHQLDSLVAFTDIGDKITVSPSNALTLTVSGPQAEHLIADETNLVLRAAHFLGRGRGADIHLEKNLPIASGVGGGSADAAATLRALSLLWDLDTPAPATTVGLGADVPVCMVGSTLRMRGVGERITHLDRLPDMTVVLVNPNVPVSTPGVFKALQKKDNPAMPDRLPHWSNFDSFVLWLTGQRNDLQAPAIQLQPVIADVIDGLMDAGAAFAAMSGSGATCYGVFRNSDTAALAVEELSATGWWCAQGAFV